MILALLINGRYIFAVDPTLTPGTLVADGQLYTYGSQDILTFVTGGQRPLRPTSVIISGSSVREYAGALVLLGISVSRNLLASLALNPGGRLTGEAAKAEPKRQGVTTAAAMHVFVRGLLDPRSNTHLQPTDTRHLRVPATQRAEPVEA